jgi:molybdopterin molybdotransferase
MNSLEQSRQSVAEAIEPLAPVRMPLADVLGCVLREEARAGEDIPAFDRSAMDGYALAADDPSERFKIIGEARPGMPSGFTIHPGECARIFTGAEIPPGASQVLKQEDVRVDAGLMTPNSKPDTDFIRHRGEDARAGDRLLPAALRLGPAEIALLASLGIVNPLVSPPCRVAHFATGDELVDPGLDPGPSQIRDSNSALVRAFVESQNAILAHHERAPDDADALTKQLSAAIDAGCELLLISGGASVGAYDFGRTALERLGFQLRFEKVNLRPGRPLAFATRNRLAAFVLPGNPLSHLAVLHCVVRVALERMAGLEPELRILNARLAATMDIGGDGRDTLWPGRVDMENGEPVVKPLRWQSSGDITGMAGLNAFIRCSVPVLDTGARVPCILLHG